MDKENTELLMGGFGLALVVGGGLVAIDRNTCIKGGGTYKLPFGPCSCPAGSTWDPKQAKCVASSPATNCPDGQTYDMATGQCVPVSTILPQPTGFKITVPATATSPTVQCTASWDPVSVMVAEDYYSLTITANGVQIVSTTVPMGTTSYQFTAPTSAALAGKVAACSP